MCYREEAIECVKDHVLLIHKQIYAKYEGDFDRIYTEGYNSKSYTGRVIEPGKILIINGSPRKKGLISQMLGIMREEAEKRGDTAVQLISKAPTHF